MQNSTGKLLNYCESPVILKLNIKKRANSDESLKFARMPIYLITFFTFIFLLFTLRL